MMTLKPKVNHALKPKPKASYQPIQGSSRGRLIALIGTPGIGKTSLAAEFPNPRFVIDPKESGIIDLQESGQVRSDIPYKNVADFTDLIKYNEDLLYMNHHQKYLILLSMSLSLALRVKLSLLVMMLTLKVGGPMLLTNIKFLTGTVLLQIIIGLSIPINWFVFVKWDTTLS
jgi:hypothetical protein